MTDYNNPKYSGYQSTDIVLEAISYVTGAEPLAKRFDKAWQDPGPRQAKRIDAYILERLNDLREDSPEELSFYENNEGTYAVHWGEVEGEINRELTEIKWLG